MYLWKKQIQDDDEHHCLDEDERYLLEEKQKALENGGFHQCPHCEVMCEFDPHDLHCEDCRWCADEDFHWNNHQCAA